MKVLVAYASQTGNTEKVAGAICDEVSGAHDAVMKKIEDVGAGEAAGYDLVVIGGPIHAGNLADGAKQFLESNPPGSGQKVAAFVTHAAPAYPDQQLDAFAEPVSSACEKSGAEYKGCFACQGFLSEALHEMIKKSQNLNDDEWAERVKQMTGHPDAEDLRAAREFAQGLLT